ncbi:VWA domain-containing protein [Asanoa sp. WMMD1127]|uniref:VWA domain-containing protein n=1 Tax=Asanoa sp. WMMD1127 TaxID=3016107 RepID=UPI0024172F93|nr:VWA domain-containing protein [Asanoa sp. WMMD1127]MDG4824170.1 VWA domain-containing protein [Asanoa sp. WMMD1127]
MSFQSPWRLLFLLAVAALLAAYVILRRRRSRYAVRFTNLRLLDKVAPDRPAWRRHVPAGLFLAMLALLVVGFARPTDEVRVPRERAVVMVAVDVSLSMTATDVAPDRLAAAKEAARGFVGGLPETFSVGLVGFAGSASVAVAPVTDRAVLDAGIERLAEGGQGRQGTAIGEAIYAALDAAAAVDPTDPPPARIVVLSDGSNTAGRDPGEAAAAAQAAGVPVDTIAFGTAEGVIGMGGGQQAVPVDGETLEAVAEQAAGRYHEAGSADELRAVYDDINTTVGFTTQTQDVSARFIGIALVLAALAAIASMVWFARLP